MSENEKCGSEERRRCGWTRPAPEEQVLERNGKNPERKSLNVQTFSDAL
jgi:hypothetical protein